MTIQEREMVAWVRVESVHDRTGIHTKEKTMLLGEKCYNYWEEGKEINSKWIKDLLKKAKL